ncbi:hypothetical protein SAMN04515695_5716 [Pseudovibrio sp. Tun.PSC04-5.I4]|nr:hypothetical protein SAMN04515695_5716 [Pseudovibrio sp. Tun.PSC04-5.I4]
MKLGGLEQETLFGSLHLKTKNFEVVYPISQSTAGLLEMEFEDRGRPSDSPGQFLSFKTLNNKWVVVNRAHMYAISWERHQQDPDDLPHSTAFYWMLGVNEKLPGFEKLHEFVGHFTKNLEQKDIDDLVRNQVLKDTDGKIFRSRFDDDMGQYFHNLSAFPERINATDLLLSRKLEDQKYAYFPAQRIEILEVPAELMDRKTIDPDEYEILDVPSDGPCCTIRN